MEGALRGGTQNLCQAQGSDLQVSHGAGSGIRQRGGLHVSRTFKWGSWDSRASASASAVHVIGM